MHPQIDSCFDGLEVFMPLSNSLKIQTKSAIVTDLFSDFSHYAFLLSDDEIGSNCVMLLAIPTVILAGKVVRMLHREKTEQLKILKRE